MKGKIDNPRMAKFFEDGTAYIAKTKATGDDPCTAISPGTEAWSAWEIYLRQRIGDIPATMKMVLKGQLNSFTAPAQLPEWFDPTYARGPVSIAPAPKPYEPPDEERARMIEKWARLRRELGA